MTDGAGVPLLVPGTWRLWLAGPRGRAVLLVLRFGLAGLLNTLFGYAAFALLLLAGLPPGAALAGATVAGVAFNFQTSRRLVFRSRGRTVRFVALYAAIFALNWLALHVLILAGMSDLAAQALLALPMAALSFAGQKVLVFRISSHHRLIEKDRS